MAEYRSDAYPFGDLSAFSSGENAGLLLLIGTLMRLPFELVFCWGIELIASLSLAVDSAREPLQAPRIPSDLELKGASATEALCLMLWPVVPCLKRSLCESARAGRDARWSAYETQSKAAAELFLRTPWNQVTRTSLKWLRVQLQLARQWPVRAILTALALASWRRLRALLGRQTPQEKLENILATTRGECDAAKALFQSGQVEEASERYSKLLELLPSTEELLLLANSTATATASPDAEVRSERVRVLVNAALCHKKQGRFDDAVSASSQALELEPDHLKALFLRGSSQLGVGDAKAAVADRDAIPLYLAAVEDLAKVVKLDPSGSVGGGAKAELQRAIAAGAAGGTQAESALLAEAFGMQVLSGSKEEVPPTAAPVPLTKVRIIELLRDKTKVQKTWQKEITALARQLAQEKPRKPLSFVEGHKKILELALPKDPLEGCGVDTEMELIAGYEEDEEVMAEARELFEPTDRGDPERLKIITPATIVKVHQCMAKELERVLEEFKSLPAEHRYNVGKACETTMELLCSIAVERQMDIRCEDTEQAVLMHELELQQDPEFTRCSERISALMQEMIRQSRPPNLDGMD